MKKTKYLIIALMLMFGVTYNVKALTDVECITGEGKNTCVLSEDIEVTESLRVQGDIVLDLNGHVIKPANNVTITGGVVGILRGGKLTIKDSVGNGKITSLDSGNVYGAVQLTMPGESATGSVATLVVESGILEGYYYAVVGNGTRHNTSITINGGTLSAIKDDGTGIYHPQDGTLVVNGGTITGGTGIEIRSGSLTVNGGVIEGTAIPVSVTPNGNGTTTTGAGIAIAQHTTLKDINVKVKDGTIKGYSALYESNPQNNSDITNQVKIAITGGNFEAINGGEAVVYSEDITDFVVRGTFNKELDAEYISDSADIKQVDGKYVIGLDNSTAIDEDKDYDISTKYESTAYVAPVETYDVDLSWDDLHWVFVYEGDITNPTKNVWLTKEKYEEVRADMQLEENELNGAILENANNLQNPTVSITVENNSDFAVDVLAAIEQKNNVENYTNPAGLQIAVDVPENVTYGNQANISALANSATASMLIKPTVSRFVNNTGATANVLGEVKITFTKTN